MHIFLSNRLHDLSRIRNLAFLKPWISDNPVILFYFAIICTKVLFAFKIVFLLLTASMTFLFWIPNFYGFLHKNRVPDTSWYIGILKLKQDKNGSTGPAFLWHFFTKITLEIQTLWKFMSEGMNGQIINIISVFLSISYHWGHSQSFEFAFVIKMLVLWIRS